MGLHTDEDAWKLMCTGCPDTVMHRNAVLEIHKQRRIKRSAVSQSVGRRAWDSQQALGTARDCFRRHNPCAFLAAAATSSSFT